MRWFAAIAALYGAIGVAAGAFGAHGLESRLDAEELEIWNTAVRYQMYHALALLATQWFGEQWGWGETSLSVAGWSFVAGVAVFSGSLYLLALTDESWLGAVTPIGGLALIVGWIALLTAAV